MNKAESHSVGDVLIVGAGAIGGVTGAILHAAKKDVCLVNRKSLHYKEVNKNGLIIEGYSEPFFVPIKSSVKELDRQFKHVLVTVKNLDTDSVMKDLKRYISSESLVYSMQNGFGNTEIMEKHIPKNQIVAAVVGWGANKIAPGKIRITSKTGDFVIGFEDGQNTDDPRLKEVKDLLSLWRPTIVTDNILGYRWSKLVVNSVTSPISALLDISIGEMFADERVCKIMSAVKEEGIQVAESHNVKLEPVDGLKIRNFFYKPKPNDNLFTRTKGRIMSFIIAKAGAKRHGKIRSSLLWDLQQSRKTEIEFINGYIVKKGKESKLETPLNSFLVKVVHELERGKRKIGLHNSEELVNIARISSEKIKDQEKR
ncbi:MAG: ketopantoate reductase family protein [Candidatus Heimdallarchaeota archaeon]